MILLPKPLKDRAWNRKKLGLALAIFSLLARAVPVDARHKSPSDLPEDVTLGHPRVWGYQRVYPLLDGLFQDVSSTQLAQLTLNPNTANGASFNAVQNAFQLGVTFSQTAGATNAAAQQRTACSPRMRSFKTS